MITGPVSACGSVGPTQMPNTPNAPSTDRTDPGAPDRLAAEGADQQTKDPDSGDQCRLVVGAEHRHRQVLQPARRGVDEPRADGGDQ